MNIAKWERECLRKKRLKDEWADQIISKAKKEGTDLYKYNCPHCQGVHLTKRAVYTNRYKVLRVC